MILDHVNNAAAYYSIHEGFEKSFAFLRSHEISSLASGVYEIEGSDIFAIVSDKQGKIPEEAKLEVHQKYLDIQFLVSGTEAIGWKPFSECLDVSSPYNSEKDIAFYADKPQMYVHLLPGNFGVFFPADGHAPMISGGMVKKVVIKVRIEKGI